MLRGRILATVGTAAALILGGNGSQALAAETHSFDPVLSLTGNCVTVTEEVDLIPDPGCPGGTHPSARFDNPAGIATDASGDIYVASAGKEAKFGDEGRIDVFDAEGHFITEFADPNGPGSMAIDSKGDLYVANRFSDTEENVVRYAPKTYKPDEGLIEYETPAAAVLVQKGASGFMSLALEPGTDQLYVKFAGRIAKYKSAAEGGGLIEEFAQGQLTEDAFGIAVDEKLGRLYVSTRIETRGAVKVFQLAAPHNLLFTIKESAVPSGQFIAAGLALAVDERTDNLYVFDGAAKKVYELDEAGTYLGTIEHSFNYVFGSQIAVDNGKESPNGGLNPKGRYLFVPSGTSLGHSYAFGPPTTCAAEVASTSFQGVSEEEAELQAEVEPCGLSTTYTFEYITQQQFEDQGESFAGAEVAGEGTITAGNAPVAVSAGATNLQPGTAYRFRVVAVNEKGSDEEEGEFATYPETAGSAGCVNEALRTGLSALLPDCRAYELVTPPDTNARSPQGAGVGAGTFFDSREASPQGGKVSFEIEGGSIPGNEATGGLAGDPYLSTRGEAGWSTAYAGPSGAEAPVIQPGSHSPDQGYSFWSTTSETFVRYPDGHSALIGRGSLADDPRAEGKLISEDGGHIVFASTNFVVFGGEHLAIQLEPNAPAEGTEAVYDRTLDEVTHVVSLLPGDVTPAENEDARYAGSSLDGRGIAFSIGKTLYLRFEDKETFEIGEGVTFAGITEGGARLFYLEGGDLYRFDAATETVTPFTESSDVTVVNVASGGTVAYFASPSVLTGEPNPNGEEPVLGEENLYRSEEGTLSFVGTVTNEDMEDGSGSGLELWVPHVASFGEVAEDPSRTTADGGVLLFESRAPLGSYDSEGHVEIYRYDLLGDELSCLSCNPTLVSAGSNASLQSVITEPGGPGALSLFARVDNLSPDGRRAFFQSTEALVPNDTDGLQDVYEWEAQGLGSCTRPGGCLYLISSGQSARVDYLYAVSDGGNDVFFRSADLLLPSDLEETPSIYDARVNGGFAEASSVKCEGEGCRPALLPPPSMLPPESGVTSSEESRKCPKGKRKVKRHGKVRCVKKHRKHHDHSHRTAGTKKKGGRK